MAKFEGARVSEALWPEVMGIAAYAGGQLAMASVDAAMRDAGKYQYPIAQTAGTAVALGTGVACIGKNWAMDFSKGLLYAASVGLVVNLVRGLWEYGKKAPARMKMSDIAALIPRKVGVLPAGMPPGLTAAQQAALKAAQARAMAAAAVSTPGVPGVAGIVPLEYE